jgi:hypothetical protein
MVKNKITFHQGHQWNYRVYQVYVDSTLKKIIIDPLTLGKRYTHIEWCRNNCRGVWYNISNDYDYMCFESPKDALKFAKIWSSLSEEELVWYTIGLS